MENPIKEIRPDAFKPELIWRYKPSSGNSTIVTIFFSIPGLYKHTCRRIPEAYCFIQGAGRQEPAVGREGHWLNWRRMVFERLYFWALRFLNSWWLAYPSQNLLFELFTDYCRSGYKYMSCAVNLMRRLIDHLAVFQDKSPRVVKEIRNWGRLIALMLSVWVMSDYLGNFPI